MRRFQKVLFALAAVVALGWIGASTASAQVTFFVSASSPRQVRQEGQAEATGVIAFSANSGGTIVANSTITLDYGATISGLGDGLACSGTVQFNGGAAAFITKTCTGNVVVLTFNAGQAFALGNSLTLSGTRVNANALGAGFNVSVTIGTSVPAASQATNPITTVVFAALTVATVQTAPSTTVKLTASGGATILFCAVIAEAVGPSGSAGQTVRLDITENFAAAFTSKLDEDGLGVSGDGVIVAPGPPLVANNTIPKFRFRVSKIPVGVSVQLRVLGGAGNTSASITTANPLVNGVTAAFKGSAADDEQDFDVSFTATNTGVVENLAVALEFFVTDIADTPFPKVESTANLRLTFRAATDPPGSPIFSDSGSARQYNGPILRTLACASYLLFPWVAYSADGTLDTGIAISNTTADPAVINSPKQKGDVTLYFWRSDGTAAPAPQKIATALTAGKSTTFVASSLGAGFTGYIIAHCTFQMGHGLAAFLSPRAGVFGASYLAISLQNPRIPVGVTESQAH